MSDSGEQADQEARATAERALTVASRAYFEAIATCEHVGGRTQEAILAAMPDEVRERMPMLTALGML